MSHIVTIQTKVYDANAIKAACRRLQWPEPEIGSAQLFSGEVAGVVIRLPEWRYPVVVDTLTGNVAYDNFNGRWGDAAHLQRFLQIYAVEKATLEARKKGCTITEKELDNGSIQLQILEAA